MASKRILALHPARREDVANLVTRQPLPPKERFDPFVFLAHHGPQAFGPNNSGLPFAPHPHRGFETVTFILEGEVKHRDNAGYESVIRSGGVQWMTAGAGIVHAEESPPDFLRQGGPLEILQLWVNLPRRLKMSPPAYQGFQADQIPVVSLDEGRASLQLIAGEQSREQGPVKSLTGVFMSTISLQPGGRVAFDGLAGRSVFLYAVAGGLRINDHDAPEHTLVELDLEGGEVVIERPADAEGEAQLLFGHGEPIAEPIFAYGPFVMNTEQDIRQAIQDYQSGRFGPAMA
jgi:redox-sensitive bicupin YhaK (pirin superfamily)